MPTYRNDTNGYITDPTTGITIGPYETVETQFILQNSNLTLVSESPYYNPLLKEDILTNPSNESISVFRNCGHIKMFVTSGSVKCYINSLSNKPGITVTGTPVVDIDSRGRIDTLIFNGTGVIVIQQFS